MGQCESCKKFNGDCGHHFVDKDRHIDYTCPAESVCDRYGWCSYFKTNDRISDGHFDFIEEVKIHNTNEILNTDKSKESIVLWRFSSWDHKLNNDGTYDIYLYGGVISD